MDTAEQLIHNIGQRPTPIRNAVLALLLSSGEALTHTEVLERLQGLVGPTDRVTVYRTLDWLVAQGLAHKVGGSGRAWRFQVTRNETMHRHAHFECTYCGKVMCLPDIRLDLPKQIPADFSVEYIELNLKGACSDCTRKMSN